MHNKELIKEILQQIDEALDTIQFRFEPVTTIDFLLDTPQGQEKLDSLCMPFFDINAEAIYYACKEEVDPLQQTIKKIINEL